MQPAPTDTPQQHAQDERHKALKRLLDSLGMTLVEPRPRRRRRSRRRKPPTPPGHRPPKHRPRPIRLKSPWPDDDQLTPEQDPAKLRFSTYLCPHCGLRRSRKHKTTTPSTSPQAHN